MGETIDSRNEAVGKTESRKSGSTESTGTRAGTGTAGTGTGNKEAGKQVEKSTQKNMVSDRQKRFEKRKEEYEKKRKEREAAGLKQGKPDAPAGAPVAAAAVETVKTGSKKRTKKKAGKGAIQTKELDAVLKPLSSAFASKPGREHWALSDAELKSITEPLAVVLNKLEPIKALNDGAELALIIAVVAVFAPRVMVSLQKSKEKKKYGKANTGSTGRKLDSGRESKPAGQGSRKENETHFRGTHGGHEPSGTGNGEILHSGTMPAVG